MLRLPTLFIIFLMWVGASPASVGGIRNQHTRYCDSQYIKFSTRKSRIEIYKEIYDISTRRALLLPLAFSIFVIGIGTILISIFDSEKGLLNILFECVSAYSTVGLSLGITANLSEISKSILIIIMFVGRVSMLSIMTAMLKR